MLTTLNWAGGYSLKQFLLKLGPVHHIFWTHQNEALAHFNNRLLKFIGT